MAKVIFTKDIFDTVEGVGEFKVASKGDKGEILNESGHYDHLVKIGDTTIGVNKDEVKFVQLTLKEAIDQGFTHYGFADREWQMVNELDEGVFEEVDEEDWDQLVLFDKKPSFPSISKERIAEVLAQEISETDYEDSGRDDDSVYIIVKDIDYTEIADTINKDLEDCKYWGLTDIKLVPNDKE